MALMKNCIFVMYCARLSRLRHLISFCNNSSVKKRSLCTKHLPSEDLIALSKQLKSDKLVKESDVEVIYGLHSCYLALTEQKRAIQRLYFSRVKKTKEEDDMFRLVLHAAAKANIPTSATHPQNLERMAKKGRHQGVCLKVRSYPITELGDSIETLSFIRNEMSINVLMYRIQDPMNYGAILRSSSFFGVTRIFITDQDSCSLSPVVSKRSSGALEISDIYKVRDIVKLLRILRQNDWYILSSSVSNSRNAVSAGDLSSILTKQRPILVIFGNEGSGIDSEIEELSTHCVNIQSFDPEKKIPSLNVAVAAGILLNRVCSVFNSLRTNK